LSAIFGVYFLDGRPLQPTLLEAMADKLSHRGPDGRGCWYSGPVGLGHLMLWATPESLHEQLPLANPGEDLALTTDARLDNREELLAVLDLPGLAPAEIPDSRLILAAYQKWGQACVEKMLGDYAFAIWDTRARQLFCARSPMGLKPFYYHYSPHAFIFASEIGALHCLPEVPRLLNEQHLADHLSLLNGDQRNTFYRDIYRLPHAHTLLASRDGLRLQAFWDLDATREIRLPGDEAYAEAMLEVFTQAVGCRLRSAYPLGSALSGGLDSSSIVVVARRELSRQGAGPLHTFSAVFPALREKHPRIDESRWIQAVIDQGGLISHHVLADQLDPLQALDISPDEPLAIPNLWLNWGCFQAARQAGVRVMLSGFDGDTVLSYGHGYLAELALSLRLNTLLEEARALAGRYQVPVRRVLWKHVVNYLAPPAVKRVWRRMQRRPPVSLFPFEPAINPTFARRVDLFERARALAEKDGHLFRSARALHRESILSGLILEGPDLMDKLGAATQVEPRLPFFDQRLVEFALALPGGQKLHNGWNRYALRRAMQGLLPPEVQWRQDKGDLSPNIRRGLLENKTLLEKAILHDSKPIADYLDLPALQAAYQRFISAPMQTGDADIFTILNAVTLSRWLQRSQVAI